MAEHSTRADRDVADIDGYPADYTEDEYAADYIAGFAKGKAARERFLAAERARHGTRTYHSDALGAVTIPED